MADDDPGIVVRTAWATSPSPNEQQPLPLDVTSVIRPVLQWPFAEQGVKAKKGNGKRRNSKSKKHSVSPVKKSTKARTISPQPANNAASQRRHKSAVKKKHK
jgi:hypothetical protein